MVSDSSLQQAAFVLKQGKTIIFPTDTVYGLGIASGYAPGPDVLYSLKQREERKPISWLISRQSDLERLGQHVPDFACVLARTFWPGPLTLIVRASAEVPERYRSREGTIGLRMPNNSLALKLMELVNSPLAATSANMAGEKPPCSASALDPRLIDQVDLVIIDDEEKSGVASTVLNCTGEHPMMVREGALTIDDIKAFS